MRSQFTFYREFYEEIKRLKCINDRNLLFSAIVDYSLVRAYPSYLPSHLTRIFDSLRPLMDADFRSAADVRRSAEYKEWRKAVFERDNYTCQLCGVRGVRLNAHHKKPFATFHNLRTDINNGITLCERCHRKVHHGT